MNPANLDQQKKLRKAYTTAFRMKRFSVFLNVLASIPKFDRPLRILDVGGVEAYWSDKQHLIGRPIEVTLLNLDSAKTTGSNFFSVAGNACAMPEFESNSFDAVHSNSVIEHVGKWSEMMAMANEVRRVASAYFVQMPYYWFPIEPHARTLFFHWLPESLRLRLIMTRDLGFYKKCNTVDGAMRTIQEAAMLDKKMFSALFPDADIISERYFGLTKSLMAVRYAMPARSHTSE
jgi:hypothetical protein